MPTVTGICGPAVTAQNGAVRADGWYAGGGLDFMVHKGSLVDVLLGVEYQHFDVSGGEAFCQAPNCGVPHWANYDLSAKGDLVRAKLTIKTQGYAFIPFGRDKRRLFDPLGAKNLQVPVAPDKALGGIEPPAEGFRFFKPPVKLDKSCLGTCRSADGMVGTDTVDAYLAGAIDIDGHISIIRKHGYRRRTDGRQMTYYVAVVSLSDASPVVPDLLQSTFPARRSTYRARNRPAKGMAHVGSGESNRPRTARSLTASPKT